MRNLVILPRAVQEATAAFEWYQTEAPGLGDAFFQRVDECINFIYHNPQWHAIVEGDYRRALVRRFPYAVFYKYDDEKVHIYSIFHCAQNPEIWQKHLP